LRSISNHPPMSDFALKDLLRSSLGAVDLLLYLAPEFRRMRDFVEWLGSAARAVNHNRAVSKDPAHHGLVNANALDLGDHDLKRSPAGHSSFDNDAPVGDRNFGSVSLDHIVGQDDRGYDEQGYARGGDGIDGNLIAGDAVAICQKGDPGRRDDRCDDCWPYEHASEYLSGT
jgi:hypothetical protein